MYKRQDIPFLAEQVCDFLGRDVVVSIDLDVFDPSQAPGVGNPEPGGLLWSEVMQFLEIICSEKKVLSLDLVEGRPLPEDARTEYLAARLLFKVLNLALDVKG